MKRKGNKNHYTNNVASPLFHVDLSVKERDQNFVLFQRTFHFKEKYNIAVKQIRDIRTNHKKYVKQSCTFKTEIHKSQTVQHYETKIIIQINKTITNDNSHVKNNS